MAEFDPHRTTVAIIPKSAATQVRVSLRIYEGHRFVDLRLFTAGTGHGDEWRPSERGFSLEISKLTMLRDALIDAEAKARSLNWLKEGPRL